MTWIACSRKDGSCVALSEDADFSKGGISDQAKKDFFHIHVDKPLEDLIHLCKPIYNAQGELVHKFKGKVDIDTHVPEKDRADVRDGTKIVEPIPGTLPDKDITVRKVTDPQTLRLQPVEPVVVIE